MNKISRFSSVIRNPFLTPAAAAAAAALRWLSTSGANGGGNDEWNDAWETAWLPDDLSAKNRAPWETDVNFALSSDDPVLSSVVDPETKAFVEDMTDNWEQRRKKNNIKKSGRQLEMELQKKGVGGESGSSLYSLENVKKDYRLTKQRVHAGLWMREIEKMEEAKLGDSSFGIGDDIERLLDSASEIFDSGDKDLNDSNKTSFSDLRNKPDGWEETTSKTQDGNIWEMSQREEDILLQEYERRIAFCKFQIASFIKTHIFSRRRPIDGWKYMIEELGPNARKGKGSVSRLPSLAEPSTQPFKEEKIPIPSGLTSKAR